MLIKVMATMISFFTAEILAANENCRVITDSITTEDLLIENCCDLGFRPFLFSEIVNKPKVYKFKNFCGDCRTSPTKGYCDTITDKGGWLVVQRRQDGSVDFNRNWVDYENGFGSLTGEFWYGLQPLHCLTNQGMWEMRIDVTYSNGTKRYFSYSSFRIGPASSNYTLNVVIGDKISDPFVSHPLHGSSFTTKDKDNDTWKRGNCAVTNAGGNAGGWWCLHCSHIFINHQYNASRGIFNRKSNSWHSLSFTEMKIRPSNCKI